MRDTDLNATLDSLDALHADDRRIQRELHQTVIATLLGSGLEVADPARWEVRAETDGSVVLRPRDLDTPPTQADLLTFRAAIPRNSRGQAPVPFVAVLDTAPAYPLIRVTAGAAPDLVGQCPRFAEFQ